MKNLLKFLALVLVVTTLSGCDLINSIIGTEITVDPTCTEDGYHLYYENGSQVNEVLPALGHTYVLDHTDDPCCGKEGADVYVCALCGDSYSNPINALEHELEDEENYFTYQSCKNCTEKFRKETENTFLEVFKWEYTDQMLDDYIAIYNKLEQDVKDCIAMTDEVAKQAASDAIVAASEGEFEDALQEIYNQYYYAEIMYYKTGLNDWNTKYQNMEKVANEAYDYLLKFYNHCFYSALKSYMFAEEDYDDWEDVLAPYSDNTLKELKDKIDELEYKLYYKVYQMKGQGSFNRQVGELIEARNQYAAKFGYPSYYEYAYERKYGREYSDEVALYKQYVKQYLVPLYTYANSQFNMYGARLDDLPSNLINNNNVFKNPELLDFVAEYFKSMKSEAYELDFYGDINAAFKDGRVFYGDPGAEGAAFTTTILDEKVMFFASSNSYSSASTFVHECGHFMFKNVNDISDFDLFETHSQGNEALFNRYYMINKLNNEQNAVKFLEYSFLIDSMDTILQTLAVDEMEEAMTKGTSSLKPEYETLEYTEYSALWKDILASYNFSEDYVYVAYYFTQRTCYAISYGISLVPVIDLLIDSASDYEGAKEKYYKLQTFDRVGNYEGEACFEEVLKYAGIGTPFEEATYQRIDAFFNKAK